ncbi:MAG: hypothetical protein ACXW0Z_15600, partial [Gemmatirosa sp.]
RVAAQIVVAVPADLCLNAVQASLDDPRLRDAYRQLRPGKEYAGWVTRIEPGVRMEIAVAALDPLTNKRAHALGWRVRYELTPEPDGRTRVEVAVEYGPLAALGGMGLMRAQAENEVARRLALVHALEIGLQHRAAVDPSRAVTAPALAAGGAMDVPVPPRASAPAFTAVPREDA